MRVAPWFFAPCPGPCLQNLMREYMRNSDRAISNIEALPGGFNALRRLYENVQVRLVHLEDPLPAQ